MNVDDFIWTSLVTDFKVKAALTDGSPWYKALSFVDYTGYFKIEASGTWNCSAALKMECGPNGLLYAPFDPKRCLHDSSPVGCLLGRFGGSIASRTSDDIFTVGSYCIRKIDADKGPLYLAINDLWTGFEDNSGELSVKIDLGIAAQGTPPAPAASAAKA